MPARDPRVDTYITNSADFARPILERIRQVVHEACPEAKETIKWQFPHFEYKGLLCSMAAFKEHCALRFWKGALVVEGTAESEDGMGQLGRITKLADLPSKKELASYVKRAMKLNEEGVKSPTRPKPKAPREFAMPDDLSRALEHSDKARATWERLSPSHKREYVEWITEAKTEPTRARRVATTLEWLAEGKPRNWKYAKG